MTERLTCPSCGAKGEATTNETGAFEVRGQYQGKAVRKCRGCGKGLAIGPFSGGLMEKPEVLPADLWRRMETMWEREFGS